MSDSSVGRYHSESIVTMTSITPPTATFPAVPRMRPQNAPDPT